MLRRNDGAASPVKKKKEPNSKKKKDSAKSSSTDTKQSKSLATDTKTETKKKLPEKKKPENAVPKKKVPEKTVPKKKVPEKKTDEPQKEQKDNRKQERDDPEEPSKSLYPGGPEAFDNERYDPSKWTCKEYLFDGKATSDHLGKMEEVRGKSIQEGIQHFQAHPELYIAMMYQSSMINFVEAKQKYHLLHRRNTYLYRPQIGTGNRGWMTLLINEYEQLPRFPNNELPEKNRDKHTDHFEFQGRKLHIPYTMNKPIMPGRGMGIGDSPDLAIFHNIDPSDVHQGTIGDCWLLGAISALAEFDGAIKKLFRKTKKLEQRPLPGPNMYTVSLYDLKTWKEVDIEIDERLPVKADMSGKLLGARLSNRGELWVSYLEKACAVHCGGWDKIHGGACTHAWSLLTGCKYQYDIHKNPQTGKYYALGKYNPTKKQWEDHCNCPHEDSGRLWKVDWPEVGGGGSRHREIDKDELFQKMCAWDKENYIVSAATSGAGGHSSAGEDDGLVDDHAYSVIECYDNVAGTGIGMMKIRNPWGQGEIEDGEFDDDGPGWDKYPEIKAELKPVVADDGIFWVTKDEFFRFFQSIYLSASNMTRFLED
ncbi:calpain family cysteine protease [Nitzschia inconspicua]|uniref:Calpain family cysteine protease n=1 Tax=Nitzschia inconspicua TaxID=303405 RepID=A0A9K3Q4T3_9STRA|nr:calpain family cysteine protease [Nitzschia inconspicua]